MDSTTPKLERLRGMRRLASGLLALMAAAFAAASCLEPRWPALSWLRAFAEAAMVGALADWFAVVALFRHPFGLPIPHTAILRRKKDEVGGALADFVVTNFLTREVIAARLSGLDLAKAVTDWLGRNGAAVAEKGCAFIPRVLDALDDEDVARLIQTQLREHVGSLRAAPALGSLLSVLTADKNHELLIQGMLPVLGRLVEENREQLVSGIESELPIPDRIGTIPIPTSGLKTQVAKYIADKAVDKVQRVLADAAEDPDHRLRVEFTKRLEAFIADLKTSPEFEAKGEELKAELLANPLAGEYTRQVWAKLKRFMQDDAAKPDSEIRRSLTDLVASLAAGIDKDEALRAKLNAGLRSGVTEFVASHAPEAGRVIRDTIAGWDGAEMAGKLEAEVGTDLQFIRINGTLIGGLVGLLLHALGVLAGFGVIR